MTRPHAARFIELDLFRGFAITGMIFFHVMWDLNYFGLVSLDNGLYGWGRMFVPVFLVLVGICLTLASARKTTKQLLLRGAEIFGLGMIITLTTLIFMPERPILFGALHCIGLSIILSVPLLRLRYYNITIATAIILTGFFTWLPHVKNPNALQLAVGIHQHGVWNYTIDYFPLFPWLGVVLLGVALGNLLYKNGERRFPFPDISRYMPARLFSWLGRHSLLIYLAHQPIIAGVLHLYVLYPIL